MKKLLFCLVAAVALPCIAADPIVLAPSINTGNFPWWVVRKVGYPVLVESDFQGTSPNTKFGTFVDGTGSVTSDSIDLFWGGKGSAKMLTDATSPHGAEIKTTIAPTIRPGDLLAFEVKWAQSFAQGTTEFQVGLESRTNTTIYQARFTWTNSTSRWKYESATGVYSDFTNINAAYPLATIDNPAVNLTAGTPVSWARIVIDPYNRQYVAFEAPVIDSTGTAYAYTYDMHGIALPSNGAASRSLFLPFTYVITHTATAEPGFTTDWCVSVIPKGIAGGIYGGVTPQEPLILQGY